MSQEHFKPLPNKRMIVIADDRTFEIDFEGHVEELMDSQGDEWDEITITGNVYENGKHIGMENWNEEDYSESAAAALDTIIHALGWDKELDNYS